MLPQFKKKIATPAKDKRLHSIPKTIYSENSKRKWLILGPLGKGGCGDVYLAQEVSNQKNGDTPIGETVAIKKIADRKQFLSELKTMKILNTHQYGRGNTPKLLSDCKKQKILIMEYLNDTLGNKFEKCQKKFSVKTIIMLAIDMLEISKDFYMKTGHVHVDIKPSNYCTGKDDTTISLIDFGYSSLPNVRLPGPTGTPLFMALNVQSFGSVFPTWQDDLESIGYVLMFFIGGGKSGLPWGEHRTHLSISTSKLDKSMIPNFIQKLSQTEYSILASSLHEYLNLSRDRSFPFVPELHFQKFMNIWRNLLCSLGLVYDRKFDWVS